MFKRDHHVRIATILQSLDAEYLKEVGCYFGGGTAIVLMRDEYRESVDIDFVISDKLGYKKLREDLRGSNNLAAILKRDQKLNLTREIRADQYGIRTMIDCGGTEVKFEIVFEGRIALILGSVSDQVGGVQTLSRLDMATTKLLANSDRWYDDSVCSRDVIDLAFLDLSKSELQLAMKKAEEAYGKSVKVDLDKAIEGIKKRPGRLQECMERLKFIDIPEAIVWEKIRKLRF